MTDHDNDIADQRPVTAEAPECNFIYNVTTQASWAVHDKWLTWMLDDFIPAILGTGCFIKHQVVRLLETDETDGPVYAVQYYLQSKPLYNNYLSLYQPGFKKLEFEKWGDGVFSFSSLMQVVN